MMPGESVLTAAATGWTGPEALAIGGVGVVAVLAFCGLWRHLSECKAEARRVHTALTELKVEVAELRAVMTPRRD